MKGLVLTILIGLNLFYGQVSADEKTKQFTFSWPFESGEKMVPRGGSTIGPDVVIVSREKMWSSILKEKASKIERDRAAIKALAGEYRASFDFVETVDYSAESKARVPYQSWGTEIIHVIADEPYFISLQHIMVMRFVTKNGSISDPFVMKHWRQDWRYEDNELLTFEGHRTWKKNKLSEETIKGSWSQSVFQVDDSPRYEAIGSWEHLGNTSIWTSELTSRPLPRREFSVRNDYDLLVGTNRLSITNTGWVHEEDNLKTRKQKGDYENDSFIHIAREVGVARYELVEEYDFSEGKKYWSNTSDFWSLVRNEWNRALRSFERLSIKKRVDDEPLFVKIFDMAEKVNQGHQKSIDLVLEVREVITQHVSNDD